jgi:tripartite-type tricarboxylate transporter receptor subunit TctC
MTLVQRRAVLALAALPFAVALIGGAALAQVPAEGAVTDKPLRLILPVGAGSGVDTIMRAVTPALSKALGGQPVVIENLPGAGGITGTTTLVKSAPDGLTLGVVSNNHVVNPSVYKKMPFDSLQDITPIMVAGATPFAVVVNPSKLPAKNVKELVSLLKAKPDVYNYASSGNGTILHLGAEMFVDEAGVVMRHIPYKGVGPMVADLIGGQVDLGVLSLPSIQGHLKSGALRAIGVGSTHRVPVAPDMPTIAEQGLPDYAIEGWFAVVGPARLPPAQVRRFHAAFAAAFAAPEVREAMAKQGNVINPTTPEAAAAFFRSEQERYAKLVKKAGISLD